ncbi:MAG: hypothetical protein ACRDKF_07225 [Actinomycetota bacterium]
MVLVSLGAVALIGSATASGTVLNTQPHNRSSLRDRVTDIRQDMSSLFEEVEDLGEPVDEFEVFDQCMYLVGVTEYGDRSGNSGYVFGERNGRRLAFAMDIRGLDPPQYQLLAFPGEEPPSIECNEDASGRPENAQ